ncbi:MAG TPA: hypothetical protein VED46_12750 [Alphaproteobacteria bacterium]|nr:hypothetical protein [Alphaproteobacteria bacterium]
MLKVAFAFLVSCASFFFAAHVEASPEPYSLRVYRLGMSQEEFRATTHPDQAEWPSARPVCSNDPSQTSSKILDRKFDEEVLVSKDEEQVGVVRCGYYSRSSSLEYAAGLVIADVPMFVSSEFFPDENGALRLMSIRSWVNNQYFDKVSAALSTKFGSPASTTEETVQNKAGAQFASTTMLWSNIVSNIVLRERDGEIHRMTLTYSHARLAEAFRNAIGGLAVKATGTL